MKQLARFSGLRRADEVTSSNESRALFDKMNPMSGGMNNDLQLRG